MRKRSLFLFGAGIVAGLSSSLGRATKTRKQTQTSLSLLYAGTWQYRDENRNRTHLVEISSKLELSIDHRPITSCVESLDATKLVYIDNFGYHITFSANESRPIKMIDEADDQEYIINSL